MIRLFDPTTNTFELLNTGDLRRRPLNYYGAIPAERFTASSKGEVLTYFIHADFPALLTEYQKLCASGVDMRKYNG